MNSCNVFRVAYCFKRDIKLKACGLIKDLGVIFKCL